MGGILCFVLAIALIGCERPGNRSECSTADEPTRPDVEPAMDSPGAGVDARKITSPTSEDQGEGHGTAIEIASKSLPVKVPTGQPPRTAEHRLVNDVPTDVTPFDALSAKITEDVEQMLQVKYRCAGDLVNNKIELVAGTLSYVRIGKLNQQPANTVESRPLETAEDLITTSGGLSAQQIGKLEQLLRKIGFLDMENSYGGPEPGGGSCDEVFEVKLMGKMKTVTYHHHPSASPMPEQLVRFRTALFELVNVKFSLSDESQLNK